MYFPKLQNYKIALLFLFFVCVFHSTANNIASVNDDLDGDGIPNLEDFDADNDGIPNDLEGNTNGLNPAGDSDKDGIPNYLDQDDKSPFAAAFFDQNNDQINDWFDEDLDGKPDFLDTDSDGDGVLDWVEGFDFNSDGESIDQLIVMAVTYEAKLDYPGYYPCNVDTDRDAIPDWIDNQRLAKGYYDDMPPPFLDAQNEDYWIDENNNGLADIVDTETGGLSCDHINKSTNINYSNEDKELMLPAQVLFCAVKVKQCKAIVDWATVANSQWKNFEIERSTDGANFSKIKVIKSKDTAPVCQYSFKDEDAVGAVHYRIKMFNQEGESHYSYTMKVNAECSAQQAFLPNFPDEITVENSSLNVKIKSPGEQIKLAVYSSNDEVVCNLIMATSVGWNTLRLDLSWLPADNYRLAWMDGESIKLEKTFAFSR